MTEDEFVMKHRVWLRGVALYGYDARKGRLSERDLGEYADFAARASEDKLREFYRELCPVKEESSARLRVTITERIEGAGQSELDAIGAELADPKTKTLLTVLDLSAVREAFSSRKAKLRTPLKEMSKS